MFIIRFIEAAILLTYPEPIECIVTISHLYFVHLYRSIKLTLSLNVFGVLGYDLTMKQIFLIGIFIALLQFLQLKDDLVS